MARKNLEEFISIYKSEPCLWQRKCNEYHNKRLRDAAYTRLVDNMKVIEPLANRDMVTKKINNLRSSYRKEKKKTEESMKPDWGGTAYEPKLWYFKLLRFLDDSGPPDSSRSNVDSDDDDNNAYENYEDEPSDFASQGSINNDDSTTAAALPVSVVLGAGEPMNLDEQTPHKNKAQKRKWTLTENHIPTKEAGDNRFDLFGKSVALKLRSLPKQQMLLAEKLMNDVMFYAELNQLDFSTRLTTDIVNHSTFSGTCWPVPKTTYSNPTSPSSHAPSPSQE